MESQFKTWKIVEVEGRGREIVKVKAELLGFPDSHSVEQVVERAQSRGLILGSSEQIKEALSQLASKTRNELHGEHFTAVASPSGDDKSKRFSVSDGRWSEIFPTDLIGGPRDEYLFFNP